MPNWNRSAVRTINEKKKGWKNEIVPKFAPEVPPLQKGCWYVAQFRNFKRGERLVVSQHPNNPVIILTGYKGGDIERNRKVICEVTQIEPNYVFGEFKEFYEKNPNSDVYC